MHTTQARPYHTVTDMHVYVLHTNFTSRLIPTVNTMSHSDLVLYVKVSIIFGNTLYIAMLFFDCGNLYSLITLIPFNFLWLVFIVLELLTDFGDELSNLFYK